jgi:hypothetical protein
MTARLRVRLRRRVDTRGGIDAHPWLLHRERHVALVHHEVQRSGPARERGEPDAPGGVRRVNAERLADRDEILAVEAIVLLTLGTREHNVLPPAGGMDEVRPIRLRSRGQLLI